MSGKITEEERKKIEERKKRFLMFDEEHKNHSNQDKRIQRGQQFKQLINKQIRSNKTIGIQIGSDIKVRKQRRIYSKFFFKNLIH